MTDSSSSEMIRALEAETENMNRLTAALHEICGVESGAVEASDCDGEADGARKAVEQDSEEKLAVRNLASYGSNDDDSDED
jgi:hypothetical protein